MTMAAKACIFHCVNYSEYGCKIEPFKQYKGRITGDPRIARISKKKTEKSINDEIYGRKNS